MDSSSGERVDNITNNDNDNDTKSPSPDSNVDDDINMVHVKVELDTNYYVDPDDDSAEAYPFSSFVDESEPTAAVRVIRCSAPAKFGKRGNKRRRSAISKRRPAARSRNEDFACTQCDKVFGTKQHLVAHHRMVHEENPSNCKICGKTYKNKELLRVHNRRVKCAPTTTNSEGPQAHVGQGSQPPAANGGASENDVIFKTRSRGSPFLHKNPGPSIDSLPLPLIEVADFPWEQLRVPVTSRMEFIVCNVCGISFPDQEKFTEHAEVEHSKSTANAQSWACQMCRKRFKTQEHLKKHQSRAHELLILHDDAKPNTGESLLDNFNAFPADYNNDRIHDSLPDLADDWFESNAPEYFSPPAVAPGVPEATSNNIPTSGIPRLSSISMPSNIPTDKSIQNVALEDLMKCPQLKLPVKVIVKKYISLLKPGYVFCDLCCLNVSNTHWLKFHMKLVHGIEYTPKRKTPTIARILTEMRGQVCAKTGRRKDLLKNSELEDEQNKNVEDSEKAAKDTMVNCQYCNKSVASEAKLRRHVHGRHGDTPKPCLICKKVICSSYQLANHMRRVHLHAPAPCKVCGKMFKSFRKANLHEYNVHRTHGRPFQCKHCDKSYKTPSGLWLHMKAWHKKKRYVCDECSAEFTQSVCLRRHLVLVHKRKPDSGLHASGQSKDELDMTVQCDQCGITCRNSETLKYHMKKFHSGRQETSHQCEVCGQAFARSASLREHRKRVHQDEPARCLFCSEKLPTVRMKHTHEFRYHWSETGYGCKVCDLACETATVLEKHVLYDHSKDVLESVYFEKAKLVPPPVKVGRKRNGSCVYHKYPKCPMPEEEARARQDRKNYNKPRQCQYCNMTCGSRPDEVAHIALVHQEYSIFRCAECGLGFENMGLHNRHNEEVHKIRSVLSRRVVLDTSRLFGCDFCRKYFMSKDGAEKHMQTAHA